MKLREVDLVERYYKDKEKGKLNSLKTCPRFYMAM
jgi:hypothetical protein